VLGHPGWLQGWPLGIAAVIVTGCLLGYLWSRRSAVMLPPRPAPVLAYDELALAALRELVAGPLVAEGRLAEFHARLSAIVRGFLGAHHGFDALEMTSDELRRALGEHQVQASERQLVEVLSRTADLAKFACHRPAPDEHETVIRSAFRLIELGRGQQPEMGGSRTEPARTGR